MHYDLPVLKQPQLFLILDEDRGMTEHDWLTSTDPAAMLNFVRSYPSGLSGTARTVPHSDRKLRLFAVACCRLVWDKMSMGCKRVVEDVERLIDGSKEISLTEIGRMSERFHREAWKQGGKGALADTFGPSIWVQTACLPSQRLVDDRHTQIGLLQSVTAVHAPLLRDIFGNPFRPVETTDRVPLGECSEVEINKPFKLEVRGGPKMAMTGPITMSFLRKKQWLQSPTVLSLAQATYDDRAFDRMPILADALEESGCQEQSILEHLRSDQQHVKGCWVIDLILGKE